MAGFHMSFLNRNEKPENPHQAPTMLYNGMLAPLKNYGIKGVIWYQGCANKGEAELYSRLQPEFVKMLRRMWCNNELPFYYAQIAGFQYTGSQNLEAALIREAQLEKVNYVVVVGANEKEAGTVSLRARGGINLGAVPHEITIDPCG